MSSRSRPPGAYLFRLLQVGHSVLLDSHENQMVCGFGILIPHSVLAEPSHQLRDSSMWMTSLPTSPPQPEWALTGDQVPQWHATVSFT